MRESRAALADAGTVVPSLRLDPVGPARGIPRPPVEPGGRRVDFAARRVAALRARRAAEA
ncbi:hypothetical protein [Streptomyces sp. NPDC046978]|uniref:hypothetical protein n=1 Tax=Streptomyces sp. NPDC046978 TaxID=3154704 RepID=UPI0033D35085